MKTSVFLSHHLNHYASTADIPVDMTGVVSEDRSAVVGHNNWCFIYDGSNDYRGAYRNNDQTPLGEDWANIIESRQRTCEKLGVDFLQVIVPNKATLLPDFYPENLGKGITVILERVLACRTNAKLLAPVHQFREANLRELLFRRNDSHLTVVGNVYLTEMVLLALGIPSVEFQRIETTFINHVGDLGMKFSPGISETCHAPIWNAGLLDQRHITKTMDVTAEGYNGIQQVFKNQNAPIEKKILVFGNSFFERVPSWGMSPIFAALFHKLHFVWTPEFNEDLIKSSQPDVVIAQTCERFLLKVPNR